MRYMLCQQRILWCTSCSLRSCRTISEQEKTEIFKKLNEYASAGLWDDRTGKPSWFLYGKDRQKVYDLQKKLIGEDEHFYQRSPYGLLAQALFRIGLGISCIFVACALYIMLVPEEHRLKYKYRKKHESEHH